MISLKRWLAGLLVMAVQGVFAQAVIPQPVQQIPAEGNFKMGPSVAILLSAASTDGASVKTYLTSRLTALGMEVTAAGTGAIRLTQLQKPDNRLGAEGYLLDVAPSGVVISANQPAGLFYGVQTLLQLLPNDGKTKVITIPAVSIVDYPRFAWRGMMLDVSRHYFPVSVVRTFIDQMARYKFNRLHWHLSDDEGWRVEIRSLPALTTVGAWRVPRVGEWGAVAPPLPGEAATDGGFYTQEEIRGLVKYAKERFIEIMPEVDVPGHSMAAIASYPELCVTKDPNIRVNPGATFATWHGDGTFTMHIDNTLNPADENVYKFLDQVVGELATLFPFEYIHIGGDECYKGYWERDAGVQAFMKKNKIADGHGLQHYFTTRVAAIVASKKKKMMGWEEIGEGGLPEGAALMSWRSTESAVKATQAKHPVVMCPAPIYYLDMMQGDGAVESYVYNKAFLKQVYQYDILPSGVDASYVLGSQGALWTEQISTTGKLEYMTYPRAWAIAESAWTPEVKKNWTDFQSRVEKHFGRAHTEGIRYAPSMYDPTATVEQNGEILTVSLNVDRDGLEIHYTLDGAVPDPTCPRYSAPLQLGPAVRNLRVTTFRDGQQVGRILTWTRIDLEKRVRNK